MKRLLALAFIATGASAQLVVHDPLKAVQDALANALNYIQHVDNTINTTTQKINQVEQMTRYGDYRTWTSKIPLVGSLTNLAASGVRLYGDYNRIKYTLDPQTIQGNMSATLSYYSQPNWQGMTSRMGVYTSPYAPNYQSANQWQSIQTLNDLLKGIDYQEQNLQTQLTTLAQQAQSAGSQSDHDKIQSQILAVNGALSQLEDRKRDIQMRIMMLNQQGGYGQQVMNTSNREQSMGQWQQGAEAGMMPAGGYIVKGTEFGAVDNPATGGTGDPGTGGNWYTGNHDNYIGGTDSVGVALPESIQDYHFGSTGAAAGQMVTVTNMETGQTTTAPIVDTSPNNKGVDLTYATARAVGLPVNGTAAQIKVTFPTATLADGGIN